ncbi:MAG TPA: transporter substrate-binding domain-containing protein [Halieaceae bacterium]|nr:transporter substrate-binding domain-containing protein [Halieaceae bacterium]
MSNVIKRLMLGGLMSLVAAFPVTSMAGDTLQRVVDFKVLKVGMSGNQPPLTMKNREGGMMGFDLDLARALAAAMKVKLEITPMPFGDLMSALDADKIDMVISGVSITPERTRLASFVGPYMMSGKSILTKNSVLSKMSSSDEFNRKDLKLAALSNSTSASFVQKVAPQATLVEIASYDEGVTMIMEGKADAMVADMPMCILSIMRYPEADLTTLDRPLTIEPIGIALNKNDPQFFNLVDNYLRAYEKTGVLTKLRQKWFEDNKWLVALP